MSGVTDLGELLASLRPVLTPGEWVFVTGVAPVEGAIATVVEEEGVTSVVSPEVAQRAGVEVGPAMARITLQVHSALEAVGLTAAVAAALAARGIPANVVAGYFHDHVFVPVARAADAVAALAELSRHP